MLDLGNSTFKGVYANSYFVYVIPFKTELKCYVKNEISALLALLALPFSTSNILQCNYAV